MQQQGCGLEGWATGCAWVMGCLLMLCCWRTEGVEAAQTAPAAIGFGFGSKGRSQQYFWRLKIVVSWRHVLCCGAGLSTIWNDVFMCVYFGRGCTLTLRVPLSCFHSTVWTDRLMHCK